MIPVEESSFHSKVYNDADLKRKVKGRYAISYLKKSMDGSSKIYGIIDSFIKLGDEQVVVHEAAEDSWLFVPFDNIAYIEMPSEKELEEQNKKSEEKKSEEVKQIESDLENTMSRVEKQKEKTENAIEPENGATSEGQEREDPDFVF